MMVNKIIAELDEFSNNEDRLNYLNDILNSEPKNSFRRICAKIMLDDQFVLNYYRTQKSKFSLFDKFIKVLTYKKK